MTIVTRRVIKPLHNMRDAMLKVAAGDLHVDTGYASRHDEIGALAGALETFKQQAADKARIEAQERERNAGATARQQTIESYVGEFEHGAPQTLSQLGDASGQMRTTSSGLSTISRQTNERVQVAEGFRRSLDERRDGRSRFRRAQRLDQRHQPAGGARRRASPAARSARRVTPTAPSRGSPNRRGGSAKS